MPRRGTKVGVQRGGGPPPGYRWTVEILEIAFDEARGILNDDQYQHVATQVRQLAKEVDPTHSITQSVDAIEDFHELREKGGILGNLNIRIFFNLDKEKSTIVVLGVLKKQNNGALPSGDRIRMARRKRKYIEGEYEKA